MPYVQLYSVFSLGKQQLPSCIAYVNRQKEHHARGSTIALFEGLARR